MHDRRRIRVFLSLVAAGAALACAGRPGRADTIFSNFAPGQTYSTVNPNNFSTSENAPNSTTVAVPFSVPAGSDYTFTSALFPLQLLGGSGNTLFQLFSNDSSGGSNTPGSVLETIPIAVSLNSGGAISEVDSTVHPVLQAGQTYWVGLQSNSTSNFPSYDLGWFSPTASPPGVSVASGTNDANWIAMSATLPTFEVDGTLPTQAPEPSSFALYALGLAGAAVAARRRTKVRAAA